MMLQKIAKDKMSSDPRNQTLGKYLEKSINHAESKPSNWDPFTPSNLNTKSQLVLINHKKNSSDLVKIMLINNQFLRGEKTDPYSYVLTPNLNLTNV